MVEALKKRPLKAHVNCLAIDFGSASWFFSAIYWHACFLAPFKSGGK